MRRQFSLLVCVLICVSAVGGGARAITSATDSPIGQNAIPLHTIGSTNTAPVSLLPDAVLIGLQPSATSDLIGSSLQAVAPTLADTFAAAGVRDITPLYPGVVASGSDLPPAMLAGKPAADLDRVYRLRLAQGIDLNRAIQTLDAAAVVAYAEPDYRTQLAAIPNDPQYADQWGLARIGAPAAWNATTGSPDVIIAVVDSGADLSHPDLAGQIWVNPGEIAGNGLDDDNDGYVDDIHGWNIRDNNAALNDATGHGTEIAGVIAAATNNGIGVAGLCQSCRLMVVKVAGQDGFATYSDIAAGVVYAAQKGAKVINLSLGGASDSITLRAAVAAAAETAVVVGGAGNSGSDSTFYPAAYDDSVLSVASVTSADTRAATSNYGAWVDVSAPGEQIVTTFSGDGYGAASGTSLAAAFVSGTAGLVRSLRPAWSPDEVRAQIIHTADDIDDLNPGYAGRLGSGRLSASRAVATPAKPALSIVSYTSNGQPGAHPDPGSTVDLYVTLSNSWATAYDAQATLTTSSANVAISNGAASYGTIAVYESKTNVAPFRFSISSAAGYDTGLPFVLHLSGADYAANIVLTLHTSPGITYVHGTLTGQQTWTADRIYVVDNDVGVGAGATLTIEPGTEVRFARNYTLGVRGALFADGTAERPIRFTNVTTETWGQIQFLEGSVGASFDAAGNYTGGSILRHVVIENGQGVALTNAAPYIAHTTFRQLAGWAISGAAGAGLIVADNIFLGTGVSLERPAGDPTAPLSFARNQLSTAALYTSGPAIIVGNEVAGALGVGISATRALTLTGNRVVDSGAGMAVSSGYVSHNLLANNRGVGLRVDMAPGTTQIGPTTVVSNTLVSNRGPAIAVQSGSPVIHSNNLIVGSGSYALRLDQQNSSDVDAKGNWWGTTDEAAIRAAIYDAEDIFGPGVVNFGDYLPDATQDAPAYIQSVTVQPDTTLGIQTATFDIHFSRPMNQNTDPSITFHTARRGTFTGYSLPGLAGSNGGRYLVNSVAIDADGIVWVGASNGLFWGDGTTWHTYAPTGSMPAIRCVGAIAIDSRGPRWFITDNSLVRFDGTTWTSYPLGGAANINACEMPRYAIAFDQDGALWFSHSNIGIDLARFDGTNITRYDVQKYGLRPYAYISAIAVDHAGVKWFGADGANGGGLLSFDGSTWTLHSMPVKDDGWPITSISNIAVDRDGTKWFTTNGGLMHLEGSRWSLYQPTPSIVVNTPILIAPDGSKWFVAWTPENGVGLARLNADHWTFYQSPYPPLARTSQNLAIDGDSNIWHDAHNGYSGTGADIAMLIWGKEYPIADGGHWLNDRVWRAATEITSLVPRDSYTIAVSGIKGTDGIAVSYDEHTRFIVDYAGQLTDRTPPPPPIVFASGKDGDPSVVEITWSANDPESAITAYRFAIGTAAGASDIVDWTTLDVDRSSSSSARTITRRGLHLEADRMYWVAVQARNIGGLWSSSVEQPFIAGRTSFRTLFLPLVARW